MRLDALERLMERLFAEHHEPKSPADAGEAAILAAALRGEGPAIPSPPGDPCELAAAYLDGALDGEARHGFEAGLARSPGEREDLESTQIFLDAVAANVCATPADLVEAIFASAIESAQAPARDSLWRRFAAWVRSRPWTIGAGGAVAVAFSVVLLVSANLDRAVAPFRQAAQPAATPAATAPAPAVTAPAPASAPIPAALPSVPAAPSAPKAKAPIAPIVVPEPAAPAATEATEAHRRMQIEEMYEGAKRDAAEAASAYDPCAHRNGRDRKDAAATDEADKTASSKRASECDNSFADHGLASQPDFGVVPSAADAMPAPADTPDAAGSTMPSAQPDTPPH